MKKDKRQKKEKFTSYIRKQEKEHEIIGQDPAMHRSLEYKALQIQTKQLLTELKAKEPENSLHQFNNESSFVISKDLLSGKSSARDKLGMFPQ